MRTKKNLDKWKRRKIEEKKRFEHSNFLTEEEEKIVKIEANHGKICSCYACGNPRKYFKERTIQEKKNDESFEVYHEEN